MGILLISIKQQKKSLSKDINAKNMGVILDKETRECHGIKDKKDGEKLNRT